MRAHTFHLLYKQHKQILHLYCINRLTDMFEYFWLALCPVEALLPVLFPLTGFGQVPFAADSLSLSLSR